MKFNCNFFGGESTHGTTASNFVELLPTDNEAMNFIENNEIELIEEHVLPHYDTEEEVELHSQEDEVAGYNDMVDALTQKLQLFGITPSCVNWWYGTDDNGNPKHI